MNTHTNTSFLKEHRLIFQVDVLKPQSSPDKQNLESNPAPKPLLTPEATQKQKDEQQKHVDIEEKERGETLPLIESEIQQQPDIQSGEKEKGKEDQKNQANEQPEKEMENAESYIRNARETLPTEAHKEVYDVAIQALTPDEKLALHRSETAIDTSIAKHTKFNLPQPKIDAISQKVFAEWVVGCSFELQLAKLPPNLQQALNTMRAEHVLLLSERDRQLSDQAEKTIKETTKNYLTDPEHPERKKIHDRIQQDRKAEEADLNEWTQDTKEWGKDGKSSRFLKSEQEERKEATQELPTIVKNVDKKRGIRFELKQGTDKEKVTLSLTPKDPAQLTQMMELAKSDKYKLNPEDQMKPIEKKHILAKPTILLENIDPSKAKILIADIIVQKDKKPSA